VTRTEFYNTKAWKRNRVAYALYRNCLCERCGRPVYVSGINDTLPKEKRLRYIVHHKVYLDEQNFTDESISLDWNNLELLCVPCHNQEHYEQSTKDDVTFDESGMLIERRKIGRGGE
jgi:5-methylcytosine-specific restriction endonuclease McrA